MEGELIKLEINHTQARMYLEYLDLTKSSLLNTSRMTDKEWLKAVEQDAFFEQLGISGQAKELLQNTESPDWNNNINKVRTALFNLAKEADATARIIKKQL